MIRGICAALALAIPCATLAVAGCSHQTNPQSAPAALRQLKPPASGVINVAFIVSENTTLIDFAGPWEVFGDTMLTSSGGAAAMTW